MPYGENYGVQSMDISGNPQLIVLH